MVAKGSAAENGNGVSNGNGAAHDGYHPADGIQGRWEGVVRPYSQEQVGSSCDLSCANAYHQFHACAHFKTAAGYTRLR